MDLGLDGKRVLVTGASQSIGRKIALAFADEGSRVSIIARREDKLREVVDEMGGGDAGHAYRAADLVPEGVPAETARSLMDEHGPFDVAVHCLGGTLEVRDTLSPVGEWQRVWRYNVGIGIELNGEIIPRMLENRSGRVIHISSMSAVDYRGCGPYASAKAYLNGYINVLGRDMAPKGVVVSGLMPGAIVEDDNNWDFKTQERPAMVADFLRHHQAIGRLGRTEEIAPFVLLLGSELNTFATGAVLPVHGGAM